MSKKRNNKKRSNKYYAIKEGNGVKNKIVRSWDECKKYVHGYNSVYKSFTNEEDAKNYLEVVNVEKVKEQTKFCIENKEEIKNKKKTVKESTKILNIRISNDMFKDLEKRSKETNLRIDDLVKFALSNYLY